MGHPTTLTLPTPAHIDNKTPDLITQLVGRKSSFRGFSASSLSSLAIGRHGKRNSIGTRKALNFVMPEYKEAEVSDDSRPPSLLTDRSSFTSASSRSPSPEPVSRLEAAYKSFCTTRSSKLITTYLFPVLSDCDDIIEADVDILFKWWNHLLLLTEPTPIIFQAIHLISIHPATRATMFWNAHYELTLSTVLSLPANVLPAAYFAKLIAAGYVYHVKTSQVLRCIYTEPTKVSSSELWVKRAKNVEVFIETAKQIYLLEPDYDDNGIVEARLEEMIQRVIHISTFPNHRLFSMCRLLNVEGTLVQKLEDCLVRITRKIGVFDCAAGFYLLEILSHIRVTRTDFWLEALTRIISTENHILQIRVFSYLYDWWHIYCKHALPLLLAEEKWLYFFTHWSGIVRDHYMRLLAFKVSVTHPQLMRDYLVRSFETSLNESCQLRDCLPGNPIPNKRFVIRPLNHNLDSKRLWDDKEETLQYKFVAEFVGKQWSLTSDAEAIQFLDRVMDSARLGKLPAFTSQTDFNPLEDFPPTSGRKRLWTRSLSEWSTIVDEADRFWRTHGRSCPRLEVEFPRWFVQRSTQVDSTNGKIMM